ncbi:histidine phosphatase family protein [Streptomyces sp. NPDC089919]|uniref:SixA phosphatase family protein n=1 Tax=Streptomyces sp. NPDC089919 TaxID=3155188 RepID=UPI003439457E
MDEGTPGPAAPVRRLVLLRHAKSAWPDGVPDHDRPLAPRGRRDAPAAGRLLRELDCVPDLVVCSTARRARETWELAAEELGIPVPVPVRHDDRVYAAAPAALTRVLREVDPALRTVALVGHNPGMEELADALALPPATGAESAALARMVQKFPTCAFPLLTLGRFTTWATLAPATCHLTSFVVARSG